jgi:hypothetical protein
VVALVELDHRALGWSEDGTGDPNVAAMVREEDHLRALTEPCENLKRSGSTLIVEVDEEIVEHERERFAHRVKVVVHAGQAQREIELVAGPVGELVDPEQLKSVRVGVAVQVDDLGVPVSSSTYPLHVYFPTEEATGLPVIVQGDFVLHIDRRQIAALLTYPWVAE